VRKILEFEVNREEELVSDEERFIALRATLESCQRELKLLSEKSLADRAIEARKKAGPVVHKLSGGGPMCGSGIGNPQVALDESKVTCIVCLQKIAAQREPPPEPQLETPEAPRPADAGEPRWEKPERVFHQKVLDDLMKGIQEHGQVLTTERNAVENLDRLFKQMDEAIEMKIAVDRAFREYSREGESLETTIERIAADRKNWEKQHDEWIQLLEPIVIGGESFGDALRRLVKEKQVGSPIDPVLNACIDVDRLLNKAMDRLRDFDIERAEDQLNGVREAFDNASNDLDNLWASFQMIDSLPGAIESLENAVADLKGRADSSSVVTDVKIKRTAEEWGLDTRSFGNVQSVISALETLNGDASLIAERILMAMLKSGGGFSKPAVQKLYESASKDLMEVLVNRYGECFLPGYKLEGRMQSFVVQYFGYRML